MDVPPPDEGLDTVRAKVPTAAVAEVGTKACSSVALTNVVVREEPLRLTTEPDEKPVPVMVSVKEVAPAETTVGEMEFTCGVADWCVDEPESLPEEPAQPPKNVAAKNNTRIAGKRR